jgi:hypothetical protein
MTDNIKASKEKLLNLLDEIVAKESALREEYHLGDKFRFVREKLQALRLSVLASLEAIKEEVSASTAASMSEDDVILYVYLFNAQGVLVPTWRKMVTPSVMYEYSVNRPIYQDEAAVQAVIRSKTDKQQHAYLAVIVKKADLLILSDGDLKDVHGHVLIRVREGSLSYQRILFFKHNDHEYRMNESGDLVRV